MRKGNVSQELSSTQFPRCVNIRVVRAVAMFGSWHMHNRLGLVYWLNLESSLYFYMRFFTPVSDDLSWIVFGVDRVAAQFTLIKYH